jgi:hypothetical protein
MNSVSLTTDRDDLDKLLAEAGNPGTTEQRLRDLLSLNHPEITVAVAENTVLAIEELLELSQHHNQQVRIAVAGNPNSDGKILDQLAADSTEEVRAAVAANNKVTPSTLLRLAEDPTERVRQKITENQQISIEVLERMVDDPNPEVVMGVATHPQATSDLLAGLAKHPSLLVKTAVAKNIRTPVAGLMAIANEINAKTAVETIELRQALAENPNSPALILLKCTNRNDSYEQREAIAECLSCHLNSPDELLDGLAGYNSLPIQENIVKHPNLHHPTLVKLAGSEFWSIQQQALQRINNSPATIDRQTYIEEADESIDAEVISVLKSRENEAAPLATIPTGDLYQVMPSGFTSGLETGRTGLSELYERTGAQLNAIHPLAILFTLLTLLCVALSLNTLINSTPKSLSGNALDPKVLTTSSDPKKVNDPKASSKTPASNDSGNYRLAIDLANEATLLSQTAVTRQDWEKISAQWNQAIRLLKTVPASDPRYAEVQGKIQNYQTLTGIATFKAKRAT